MSPIALKLKSPKFPVGAKVRVRLGNATYRAQIVEDRGPIGKGGRRLFRIQVISAPNEAHPPTFEVPAEDLIATSAARHRSNGRH